MRTTGEKIAGIFRATYVAIALLGFVATSGVGFADTQGNNLLGIFEINPLTTWCTWPSASRCWRRSPRARGP